MWCKVLTMALQCRPIFHHKVEKNHSQNSNLLYIENEHIYLIQFLAVYEIFLKLEKMVEYKPYKISKIL